MTFAQYLIAFLVLYICIYALIDRLCKCIEQCAVARAFYKFCEKDETGDENELSENHSD